MNNTKIIAALLAVSALVACGGGGNTPTRSTPATTPTTPTTNTPMTDASTAQLGAINVSPIYIDGGPAGSNIPNAMYTDIVLCTPGDTFCAVIKHVLVDTGSVGLRLFAEAIPANILLGMPQSNADTGSLAGECLNFASGVTWGGVRTGKLRMGGKNFDGETALNLSIQVIGDPDARLTTVPASCSSQGRAIKTVSSFGATGILGIGLFTQDCGVACERKPLTVYYACSATGDCTPSTMASTKQVSNPIASFGKDSNGSTIVFPSLTGSTMARADGLLVFGIGTRANNGLAPQSTILGTNFQGHFQSVFNGNTLSRSFIDSGSSATLRCM